MFIEQHKLSVCEAFSSDCYFKLDTNAVQCSKARLNVLSKREMEMLAIVNRQQTNCPTGAHKTNKT